MLSYTPSAKSEELVRPLLRPQSRLLGRRHGQRGRHLQPDGL